MSVSSESLVSVARGYGIVGTEMDAFSAGLEGIQPHPQDPDAYCLWKPVRKEAPRSFGCAEIHLDDWTNPQDPKPIGISYACGGDELWTDGTDDVTIANRLLDTLIALGAKASHLVVWNGTGIVFHTFLRHLARPLVQRGCVVQPLVTGVDIKAIIVKLGGRSWTLCDAGTVSGLSTLGSEGFCQHFGGGLRPQMTRASSLWLAMDRFQKLLIEQVGVAIRPTIAAIALKAARYYLPEGVKWYRPNLGLESVCRYGGAYRGGYVYSEGYQGPAWRIDVNKMYTTLLRSPLPAGSTFSHAGEYGREHAGIFLCRVEGEGYFPSYISAFTLADRRFHKQRSTRPAAWAFLPSPEISALRAIGYQVHAGLGWRFTKWVSLKGYADHLLTLQTRYKRGSPESLVGKMLGNALTGKLGQAPDHLDVCYSLDEPSGGWLPYVTAEREVIADLWIKRGASFSGGQHVDAAAWLTAQGRAKVLSMLATVKGLGWRALHVDTDGIILDSDPTHALTLSADRPGAWRSEGSDPDCLVVKGKWYSYRGETHTAGLTDVTREQLEAIHYGRRLTIGRKILANPLASGPIYQPTAYSFGG